MSLQEPNWDAFLSSHPALLDTVVRRVLLQLSTIVEDAEPERDDLLTVAEVATRLRVNRRWVYTHQAELGAIKLGSGPKARLRFDPHVVDAHLLPNAPVRTPITVTDPSGPTSRRRRRRLQSRPLPALDQAGRNR
jgi:hypothetical protein